jgi:hypothetical protein
MPKIVSNGLEYDINNRPNPSVSPWGTTTIVISNVLNPNQKTTVTLDLDHGLTVNVRNPLPQISPWGSVEFDYRNRSGLLLNVRNDPANPQISPWGRTEMTMNNLTKAEVVTVLVEDPLLKAAPSPHLCFTTSSGMNIDVKNNPANPQISPWGNTVMTMKNPTATTESAVIDIIATLRGGTKPGAIQRAVSI